MEIRKEYIPYRMVYTRRIIYGMLERGSESILNSFRLDINLWICLHLCPLIGIIRINKMDIGKIKVGGDLNFNLLKKNHRQTLRVRKVCE